MFCRFPAAESLWSGANTGGGEIAMFFPLKLSICFVIQESSQPLQLNYGAVMFIHLVFQLDHWPDSKSYANSEGVRKVLSPSGTRFLGRIPPLFQSPYSLAFSLALQLKSNSKKLLTFLVMVFLWNLYCKIFF